MRLRAAFVATRIAEWFRDSGRHVVLMMDSVTRVAMAQREIGLSAGEPPATRGYPPSVFALLPQLLERAGTCAGRQHHRPLHRAGGGRRPAGPDRRHRPLDPGRPHRALPRLATRGHFPGIDVLESISRVAPAITGPEARQDAQRLRRLMAAHRDVRELVEIGAYVAGTDPDADTALRLNPQIEAFLRQDMGDVTEAALTWAALHQLVTA